MDGSDGLSRSRNYSALYKKRCTQLSDKIQHFRSGCNLLLKCEPPADCRGAQKKYVMQA